MSACKKALASVLPEDLLGEMLLAIKPKTPPTARREKLKQSLLSRVGKLLAESRDEVFIVRADAGTWITFAPQVEMKVLHDDGNTRAWLARLDPGGRIPAHLQSGDEEAIIMSGWCYLDDVKVNCGDYHRINKGARHGVIHSPDGCLIFVRSHSLKRHVSELVAAG